MNPEAQAAEAALRFHNEHCAPDSTMHPDCPYSLHAPKAVRRLLADDRITLADAYVALAASPADAAVPTARKYHVEALSDGHGWQIIDRNGDAELGTFLVASCRRRSDAFAIKAALVARDVSAVAASPADDGGRVRHLVNSCREINEMLKMAFDDGVMSRDQIMSTYVDPWGTLKDFRTALAAFDPPSGPAA